MATDFEALIKARLDRSQFDKDIQSLRNGTPVVLGVNTNQLITQIETALRSHTFNININPNFGSGRGNNFQSVIDRIDWDVGHNASLTQIQALESRLANLRTVTQPVIQQFRDLRDLLAISGDTTASEAERVDSYRQLSELLPVINKEIQNIAKAERDANQAQVTLSKSTALSNDIRTWMQQNSKAAEQYNERLRGILTTLNQNSSAPALAQARQEFREIQSEAKNAQLTVSSFGTQLKDAIKQSIGLGSLAVAVRKVATEVKQAIDTIVGLDDALVDLRKTTTATASELNEFYFEANDIAKQYGTTTQQIIQSAADWSRMGYSLPDSKTMSQMSSMFAAISPNMDVEEATSGLISTMKAFGIGADDVLDGILSKINIIGNSFAVDNAGITSGLTRMSAAMSALGQDLDSTIALFTGANEILQNPESTATALRNMSLRIRGFDEETEELSDDLVDLTGKIADLTKTSKRPMGVSVFTDATQTEYKDLVDYFRELSEIWDDMEAKNQVALLNDLFGKRGSQAGSAIIRNFDTVDGALAKMSDSAGNAEAEMAIITDSLTYKLNRLSETGTGIWQNLLDRGVIGQGIDLLSNLLSVIEQLSSNGFPSLVGAIAGLASLKGLGERINQFQFI